MKKSAFIIFCFSAVVFACSKTTPPNFGTVYATVNGINDTFAANVLAIPDSVSGSYSLSVVGFISPYGNSAEMGFQITSPKQITTGTYTTDSVAGNKLTMIYVTGDSTTYNGDTASATNKPSVTITKFNAGNVQGTFSGTTFYSDTVSTKAAVISNGRFNVYLKRNQ